MDSTTATTAAATLKVLSSELDTEELTRVLSCPCDLGWRRGDSLSRRRRPKVRRGEHGWVLHAGDGAPDPAGPVGTLVGRIAPAAAVLAGLVAAGAVRVELVVFRYGPDGGSARADLPPVTRAVEALAALLGIALEGPQVRAAGSSIVAVWSTTRATPMAAAS